jgi:hypothetical protein
MRAISAILASRTENVIARYATKPRSKWTTAIKFVNALPRSDDCFLEDIIHGRFFECERMNESVEHFSVLSNEDVEETFCAHWGDCESFNPFLQKKSMGFYLLRPLAAYWDSFDLESLLGIADHCHADLRPQDALWRFSPFLWDVAWVSVFHSADLATSVDLRGVDVEDIRLRD